LLHSRPGTHLVGNDIASRRRPVERIGACETCSSAMKRWMKRAVGSHAKLSEQGKADMDNACEW